jgi:hypothetical protein
VQEAGDRGHAALGVQVQEAGELRLGGFDQLRPGLEQAAVLASKIMVEETTSPRPALERAAPRRESSTSQSPTWTGCSPPATDLRTAGRRALT